MIRFIASSHKKAVKEAITELVHAFVNVAGVDIWGFYRFEG